jgi:hypothetical protein
MSYLIKKVIKNCGQEVAVNESERSGRGSWEGKCVNLNYKILVLTPKTALK